MDGCPVTFLKILICILKTVNDAQPVIFVIIKVFAGLMKNRKVGRNFSGIGSGCIFLMFHPKAGQSGSVGGECQEADRGLKLCKIHLFLLNSRFFLKISDLICVCRDVICRKGMESKEP